MELEKKKYELALRTLYNFATKAASGFFPSEMSVIEANGMIKELVQRETPMKPIWKQSFYTHKDVKIPFCRICEQNLSDHTTFFHRCRNPKCEQLVDWSEDNEDE